jgi:hypothetical protein
MSYYFGSASSPKRRLQTVVVEEKPRRNTALDSKHQLMGNTRIADLFDFSVEKPVRKHLNNAAKFPVAIPSVDQAVDENLGRPRPDLFALSFNKLSDSRSCRMGTGIPTVIAIIKLAYSARRVLRSHIPL